MRAVINLIQAPRLISELEAVAYGQLKVALT